MALAEDFGDTGRAPVSACPACVVVPAAERIAALRADRAGRIVLSLPNADGAQSISTVEAAVQAVPGVISARVNLTLKRVSVEAQPSVTAAQLNAVLAGWIAVQLQNKTIQVFGKWNQCHAGAD